MSLEPTHWLPQPETTTEIPAAPPKSKAPSTEVPRANTFVFNWLWLTLRPFSCAAADDAHQERTPEVSVNTSLTRKVECEPFLTLRVSMRSRTARRSVILIYDFAAE